MLITYEIEYDPHNQNYFLPLSAKDRLIIEPPLWLQFKFSPSYYYNDKPICISKNKKKPTQLTLSNGESIEMHQVSWKTWKDVLPQYKVNGITSSVKNNFSLYERALIFMPLALTLTAGSTGFFVGSIAVGLNLSLSHLNWPKWQRSSAMVLTTLMASLIVMTGVSTFLNLLESHKRIQQVSAQVPEESLYVDKENGN